MSQEEEVLPPVLTASVHDVRYFAALLRGVNFNNRATVIISESGLTITVEEARTLLGTAYIFSQIFDEYAFHPEPPLGPPPARAQPERIAKAQKKKKNKQKAQKPPRASTSSTGEQLFLSETESESEEDDVFMDKDWEDSQDNKRTGRDGEDEDEDHQTNAAFEIPLNTLIECLNIFGTAGPSTSAAGSSGGGASAGGRGGGQGHGWRRGNDNDESDVEEGGERRRGALDGYFGGGGSEKRTGMRLSYPGAGYPLTLIIAEDASGPTTTCEITTFDPEPQLELDFDNSKTVLKIILKSSWLRDALSELDPSCEKLTFVGNPPTLSEPAAAAAGPANPKQGQRKKRALPPARPMLRIQATGTFGSTEMDYPNDRDVLETFECTRSVIFSYRVGHIARTLRALQSSTKTSLRIDEDGLLSLQFLMPSSKVKMGPGGGADAFIEFRCLALDDDL